ncbi:MAG: zf-TFIIB domain-containing protein, partial [Patescibacteria group bacterium]
MTNKICPSCKTELLENIIFHNVEADYCKKCLGLWFEEDELRQAKDSADMSLNWLDTDLWKEIKNFIIARDKKLCPACRLPFYEVEYGKSGVAVDLCNVCRGIWLDRGEFKGIMEYLKEEGAYEVLNDYSKKLLEEFWEVFTGPETLREEVSDFLTLSKLLQYKFAVQHSDIAKIISQLP